MAKPGSIRIIGGDWRRRRLPVPDDDSVRPTPDRVRETLFNWLAPDIVGARCVDLFAGSGSLGIEAASRGAAEVVLIEYELRLAERLAATVAKLGATNISVSRVDALAYLHAQAHRQFDVAFIDPPFGRGLEVQACEALSAGSWLTPDAAVYVETASRTQMVWPIGWEVMREKEAGQVRYYLAKSPSS